MIRRLEHMSKHVLSLFVIWFCLGPYLAMLRNHSCQARGMLGLRPGVVAVCKASPSPALLSFWTYMYTYLDPWISMTPPFPAHTPTLSPSPKPLGLIIELPGSYTKLNISRSGHSPSITGYGPCFKRKKWGQRGHSLPDTWWSRFNTHLVL